MGTTDGTTVNISAGGNLTGQGTTKFNSVGQIAPIDPSFNIKIGENTGDALTFGIENVFVGYQAGENDTTGSRLVGVGFHALNANTTGTGNVAIGDDALVLNTTGSDNLAVGTSALAANTTSSNLTALGYKALTSNTTGVQNTAVGYQALAANTSGSFNMAIGSLSMVNNTTGTQNIGVGDGTLSSNTTGQANSAFGHDACAANLTGNENVGIGNGALFRNTAGSTNTAVGALSLSFLLTGTGNTALGIGSGNSFTSSESFNIAIGNLGVIGDNNNIRIGTPVTHLKNFQAGIVNITTDINDAIGVVIDSAGQLGTLSSSIRYKENVEDMNEQSASILNLRPVTFTYKSDKYKKKQFGLIAEEVYEVEPNIVVRNNEGEIETIQYHELVPRLLNEVIKLRKEVDDLKNKN